MIDAKEADSHLIGQDAALVLVVAGCFSVSQRNEEGKEQELHLCYAGKKLKGWKLGGYLTQIRNQEKGTDIIDKYAVHITLTWLDYP